MPHHKLDLSPIIAELKAKGEAKDFTISSSRENERSIYHKSTDEIIVSVPKDQSRILEVCLLLAFYTLK